MPTDAPHPSHTETDQGHEHPRRLKPGERLAQVLWLRALTIDGRLPMPTTDRLHTLRALATDWEAGDRE